MSGCFFECCVGIHWLKDAIPYATVMSSVSWAATVSFFLSAVLLMMDRLMGVKWEGGKKKYGWLLAGCLCSQTHLAVTRRAIDVTRRQMCGFRPGSPRNKRVDTSTWSKNDISSAVHARILFVSLFHSSDKTNITLVAGHECAEIHSE